MHDAVFRVETAKGEAVYVRADDGSAPLLRRIEGVTGFPSPQVVDERDGWLVLTSLPGKPLHDNRWLARETDAMRIAAEALIALERHGLTHGDMCLPNILGDLETGRLSGIVDWRYAGRFERMVDVASAVWSCGYNGYSPKAPISILGEIGWPRSTAAEVEHLSRVWTDLAGPAD